MKRSDKIQLRKSRRRQMTDDFATDRLALSRMALGDTLQSLGIVGHHDVRDEGQTPRLSDEFLGAHAAAGPEACPPNLPLQGVHELAMIHAEMPRWWRSGTSEWSVIQAYTAASVAASLPITQGMLDAYIASLPLDGLSATQNPGDVQLYNDTGYYLLGRVVAKLLGAASPIIAYGINLFPPLNITRIRAAVDFLSAQPGGVRPSLIQPVAGTGVGISLADGSHYGQKGGLMNGSATVLQFDDQWGFIFCLASEANGPTADWYPNFSAVMNYAQTVIWTEDLFPTFGMPSL
jgi:hypothetical protein